METRCDVHAFRHQNPKHKHKVNIWEDSTESDKGETETDRYRRTEREAERERDRERQRERTEIQTKTERKAQRQTQRHRETQRETQRQT